MLDVLKILDDTKGVIRSHNSKKYKKIQWPKEKGQNNDILHRKLMIEQYVPT
jgi:hypothetical protein